MNRIRNSAKAIIIQDGKLLVIKKQDELGDYYILPGGGQHYGETLADAVKREVLEETTLDVSVRDLRFIRDYISQNHEFAGIEKDAHQVEFIFACDIVSAGQARLGENPDDDQIDVGWLLLEKLMELRLYPLNLRPHLLNADANHQTVYLGDIN